MSLEHRLLISIFAIQGLAMFVDEFYFHRKRGLGVWERWGHPVDTLSVLLCYLWLFLEPYTSAHLGVFLGLTFFSSLLITKDEFVHHRECQAGEQWLHALLFVIHPVSLLGAGFLWYSAGYRAGCSAGNSPTNSQASRELSSLLSIQIGIILTFILYQIGYWGLRNPIGTQHKGHVVRKH